jgi:hypothetical protein
MQGDAASDIMRIDRAGAVLSHGRATAGDPGFASDTDFDTGSGGVQTVNASTPFIVSINAGPGSDVVALGGVGQSASTLQSDFNIDGGGDFDAVLIDASEDIVARTATFASSIGTGSVAITGNGGIGDFSHTDVETVALRFGSASDSAVVNSTESGVSVEGGGGNDTVTVGAAAGLPSIVGRVDFDGDAGTLNAGGGNDLISSRDAIGDTTNCGAGDDFVLSDSLDTLNECESSDRTLAQPPSGGGGDGSTDTSMTTMMTSMMTMPADMADKTAPTAALSGLKSSVRLKTLLRA